MFFALSEVDAEHPSLAQPGKNFERGRSLNGHAESPGRIILLESVHFDQMRVADFA